MYLNLYNLLLLIVSPFLWIYIKIRVVKNKEDPSRISERFGIASESAAQILVHDRTQTFNPPILMINVASVGEANSALPFLSVMHKLAPSLRFLFTSTTVTSARLIEKQLEQIRQANPKIKCAHQFIPIDKLAYVKAFVNFWQPVSALFFESEIWPNILTQLRACTDQLFLINAKLSDKSYKGWSKVPKFAEQLFRCFKICFAASALDMKRLKSFAHEDSVEFVGNIKYCTPINVPSQKIFDDYLLLFNGSRPTWIAASTHPTEEECVLDAHNLIKQKFSNVLTVTAPRHTQRVPEIKKMFEMRGIKTQLKSEAIKVGCVEKDVEIVIIDSMGELLAAYSAIQVVFVGGSIANIGGHNPLEPARYSCAICMGPHFHKCRDIFTEMSEDWAIKKVMNHESLADFVINAFSKPDIVKFYGKNAKDHSSKYLNVVDEISYYLVANLEASGSLPPRVTKDELQ